jgi:hypothetical protein
VTVKSGKGAVVVSGQFDTSSGQITLSKDVSNYVVWTCPPATTTSGATTTLLAGGHGLGREPLLDPGPYRLWVQLAQPTHGGGR